MIDSIGRDPIPNPGYVKTHIWNAGIATLPNVGQTARKTLASNLNRLMEASEDLKTVKQLWKKSGVSTGTIDRLRRSEVNAGVDHLDLLAKAFRLTPWELLAPAGEKAGLPFRDLNTFEGQLVTFFRQLKPDMQHEVLTALNDLVRDGKVSSQDPFPGNDKRGRGKSRLGELLDIELPIDDKPSKHKKP